MTALRGAASQLQTGKERQNYIKNLVLGSSGPDASADPLNSRELSQE
jgi:hypothetical protein